MSFLQVADYAFRSMSPDAQQQLDGMRNWISQKGTQLEINARNWSNTQEGDTTSLVKIINSVRPDSEITIQSRKELEYRERLNQEIDDYIHQVERDLNSAYQSSQLDFSKARNDTTITLTGEESPIETRPRQQFGLDNSEIKNEISELPDDTPEGEAINKGRVPNWAWSSTVISAALNLDGNTADLLASELSRRVDEAEGMGKIWETFKNTIITSTLAGSAAMQDFIEWARGDSQSAQVARWAGGAALVGGALCFVMGPGGAIIGTLAGKALSVFLSAKGAIAGVGLVAGFPILQKVIRWGVTAVQRVWNFNFNASDADLNRQQEQRIEALYGVAGGALGSALGRILCGGAGVGSVAVFNPKLAASVAAMIGPEQLDEVMDEFTLLLRSAQQVAVAGLMTEGYKNVRSWIKAQARSPWFQRNFPKLAKIADEWGKEGGKAWSFAIATENFVESIENQRIQNFVEEFLEEFGEGCSESLLALTVV